MSKNTNILNVILEYQYQFKRVNGRAAKIDCSQNKYLVIDIKEPFSARYNTGIKYTFEQLQELLAHLKTRADFKTDELIRCPSCDSKMVVTKSEVENFQYGDSIPPVVLSAKVNIHTCETCGMSYTSSDAEEARQLAVDLYLLNLKD